MVKSKKGISPKLARVSKPGKKSADSRLVRLLFAVGVFIFLVSGIFYYSQIYTKPSNVFWDMIDNSLSTKGVTRQVIQDDGSTKSDEYAQFNFGTPTAVKLTRTLTSSGSNNLTKLEGLGFGSNDFQRYIEAQREGESTAEQDFDKVLNKWVVTGSTDQTKSSEQPNILLRALLGPVLSGNLPAKTRQAIVNDLISSDTYTVDFDKTEKVKENGRSVYKFNTTVDLKKFVSVMNKYATVMGIPGAESIDPSAYKEGDTIKVVVTVDLRSRQLVKVDYADSNVKESYSGYGVTTDITEPTEYLTSEQFRQLIGQ